MANDELDDEGPPDMAGLESEFEDLESPVHTSEEIGAWAAAVLLSQGPILEGLSE